MTITIRATPRPWRLDSRLPWMICVNGYVIATTTNEAALVYATRRDARVFEADAHLIVTAVNEDDALKAVETAARRLKAERDTDAATGANDDALETADAELDEALAALDAIRAQEAVR